MDHYLNVTEIIKMYHVICSKYVCVNTIMCTNAVCLTQINVHAHLMLQNFIHLLYNSINNFTSHLPKIIHAARAKINKR